REVLDQLSARLDPPPPYRSPWGSLFSLDLGGEDAGYFLSDDKRLLFLLVEATRAEASFTNYRDALDLLRAAMAHIGTEFPDVKAGLTGAPVLANDEMEAAFRDSKRATALAFALTLAVLAIAFRRFGMPVLVLATLAVSLCWSLGVVTLVVGHLSIFSIMFISIVVGLGTDYGVYLIFRNEEERRVGRSPRGSVGIRGSSSDSPSWPPRSRSSRCAASASTTTSSTSRRAAPSRSTGRSASSAPRAARASSRSRPPGRSTSSVSGSPRSRHSIPYPRSNRCSL